VNYTLQYRKDPVLSFLPLFVFDVLVPEGVSEEVESYGSGSSLEESGM
jgi:hypothetical protein